MMKCNMVIELRVKDGHDMVQDIASLDAIDSVSLISHDGEVTF